MKNSLNRRNFLTMVSATGASTVMSGASAGTSLFIPSDTPALLGGEPIRREPFPSWPIIEEEDRRGWASVLESGHWNRGRLVESFENSWREALGCRYAIATANGTSALCTSLSAMGIGPGDEVIVPPYTFVATINVVLLQHALPIFVDTDRETFQIDPGKVEAAITERTRCIMPVHLGGNVADMDRILAIGRKHGIPVLEDACQAHLAEWRHRKVGTLGDAGCFSFQASKNLNCGEGGCIVTNSGELAVLCSSFHNAGRPYSIGEDGEVRSGGSSVGFSYVRNGDNRRITEFQGALLLDQMKRLEDQTRRREQNAAHLTRLLDEIPGIEPARMHPGCTRNAYHLYMFRYDPEPFKGLPRARFIEAMSREGIPCSPGYSPLNKEPFLTQTFESRAFQNVYGANLAAEMKERSNCPENDQLCDQAVWLLQTQLLGTRADMEDVASAARKIHRHAESLSAA